MNAFPMNTPRHFLSCAVHSLLCVAMAAGLAACSKSDDAAPKAGDQPASGETKKAETKAAPQPAEKPAEKPAPAGPEWLKIEKFGVQIEVPAGAKASDGAGTSLMISAPDGSCTVMLAKKDDMSFFSSYDSTIGQIEKGTSGAMKEMLVKEKTDDDNWVLHYTKGSMMDPNKTQHAVDVRKKVGDGVYSCTRVSNTPEDATCILNACKSLKAL